MNHKQSLLAVPIIMLITASVFLTGCDGSSGEVVEDSPSAAAETESPGGQESTTAEPISEDVARSVTVVSLSGTVEVDMQTDGQFTSLAEGAVLDAGALIKTGEDGEALLHLDDGTSIVVSANSEFRIETLEGSSNTPVSRFFLNLGSVFNIRGEPLPDDAIYEIETPQSIAAIRGSSMSVSYDPDTSSGSVTCLEGTCGAQRDSQDVMLTGGEAVLITADELSDPIPMSPQQLAEWDEILQFIEEQSDQALEDLTACACEGATFTCADGTSISSFPTCKRQVCECDGTTLNCEDGTTYENDPICGVEIVSNPFLNPDAELAEEFNLPEDLPPDAGKYSIPKSGPWRTVNHPGTVTCEGMTLDFPASEPEVVNVVWESDGITLSGTADTQGEPIDFSYDASIQGRFHGTTTIEAAEGSTTINFHFQVVTDEYLIGYLRGESQSQGVQCVIYRTFEMTYVGD